ncbi:MAG: integrase arm-type DNA-binding domain-containing protein [Rhodopila sp.]|nr:integrase arm-type DNA-binding domain-containing protein [Rhodopila sp.]
MGRELTDAYLRTIKRPEAGRLELRDNQVVGLVLRMTPAGVASWSLRSRTRDGKQTRPTLGTWPSMSIKEARRAARSALVSVQGGGDPVGEKQAARAARKAQEAEASVSDRLTEWQTARAGDLVNPWSPRHAAEIGRLLKHDIPAKLAAKPLTATMRSDWTNLVTQKRKLAPAAASNLYRALSAFLGYAEACGWITTPLLPRKGAAMLAPAVPSRERVLSDDELARVWRAADREAPKLRAFVRLLILTAGRETEVADIAAGEVDMAIARWTLPANRTKNNQALTVPLCKLATAELRSVWPNGTPPPGWRLLGRSGTSGFRGFSRLKERIDAATGVDGWRWHDLRRTARTGMTRLGVTRDHAEAAINHVSGRTKLERTYDRHDYGPEVIAALEVWQSHVAALVKGAEHT